MSAKISMKRCPKCTKSYPIELVVCPADKTLLMSKEIEPRSSVLVGQVLDDRYRIDETIYIGQNSTICKATHITMERPVAIKVLNESNSQDQISTRRFQQEAQVLSHLSLKGLPTVYDYGWVDNGRQYYVMDLLDGTTLDTIVHKEGPLEPTRFLTLFRIICKTLSYMHEMGVMHRNLKPNHVLVRTFSIDEFDSANNPLSLKPGCELPVLLDLGVCDLVPSSSSEGMELTKPGDLLGTPEYMSPQQAMGDKVDHRTDVYGLGALMYFALTGKPPHAASNQYEVLQKVLIEEPDFEMIPTAVRSTVKKAMAKRVDDRFQSVKELLANL